LSAFPLRLLDDHLELARELLGVDQRVGVGVELHVEPAAKLDDGSTGVVAGVIVDRRRVEVAAHAFVCRAISPTPRVGVPLKYMCSSTCAMPTTSSVSSK
jgi:hypothetical protein